MAKSSVRPPTLPRYISAMSTILENSLHSAVTPQLRPTVAIAEAHSNTQSGRLSPSTILIIELPAKSRKMYIKSMVTALFTASFEIRLLNTFILSSLFINEMLHRIRTAIVVVLNPPAVDAGEPPISISITVIR